MSEHHACVIWHRTSADFTYDTYNRAHEVRYKSGAIVVPSSSAPAFKGDADRVDPEEAFVAALSACHMLTLPRDLRAQADHGRNPTKTMRSGYLEKDGGKLWMTRVILKPRVRFAAEPRSMPKSSPRFTTNPTRNASSRVR